VIKSKYIILISLLIFGCKAKSLVHYVPILDSKNKLIGDSIFDNNVLTQIIFIDSTYIIDSIVYERFRNGVLKSIQTYRAGKNIFENILFYENGNIKKYRFIDDDNPNYYYERSYNSDGIFEKSQGNPFYQGYIIDTTSTSLKIKKGNAITYLIFYPHPPDCKTTLYVKYSDSVKYNVFKKSPFLNFLSTVSQDNDSVGTFRTNILLEIIDRAGISSQYEHSVIFDVVP
jgi:hypothetical protein